MERKSDRGKYCFMIAMPSSAQKYLRGKIDEELIRSVLRRFNQQNTGHHKKGVNREHRHQILLERDGTKKKKNK